MLFLLVEEQDFMTEKEFRDILLHVRGTLLDAMEKHGFWHEEKLRFDPTPWDINNGLCDEFADTVVGIVKERYPKEKVDAPDLREYGAPEEVAHVPVVWRGKFYDAECIKGVKDWKKLPLVVNRKLPRPKAIGYGKKC